MAAGKPQFYHPSAIQSRRDGTKTKVLCGCNSELSSCFSVCVQFVRMAAFAKFQVVFELEPGKYPKENVKWNFVGNVGDIM